MLTSHTVLHRTCCTAALRGSGGHPPTTVSAKPWPGGRVAHQACTVCRAWYCCCLPALLCACPAALQRRLFGTATAITQFMAALPLLSICYALSLWCSCISAAQSSSFSSFTLSQADWYNHDGRHVTPGRSRHRCMEPKGYVTMLYCALGVEHLVVYGGGKEWVCVENVWFCGLPVCSAQPAVQVCRLCSCDWTAKTPGVMRLLKAGQSFILV